MHAVSGSKVARLSVTAGYDAIAAGYDEQVRGDDWMRRALHAHYRRVFRPTAHVLDVGCGTGIDAVALARMGVRVLGIDGSAGMVARFRTRITAEGLDASVASQLLDIQDLGRLGGEQFDGLISAFASLSSLPDLEGFAADAARLLRPGARMVLHLLNRFSSWEFLGYLHHANWSAARQLGRLSRRTFVIGAQRVQHTLYFADDAYRRFFSRAFIRRGAYGLGALRPPHTVRRIPQAIVRQLEALDVRLGKLPLVRDAGRFFVLDLERRSA